MGCIHMTIRAVLIETLLSLELKSMVFRFFYSRRLQLLLQRCIPVFAWKGMNDEEFDWCIEQTILEGGKPWMQI